MKVELFAAISDIVHNRFANVEKEKQYQPFASAPRIGPIGIVTMDAVGHHMVEGVLNDIANELRNMPDMKKVCDPGIRMTAHKPGTRTGGKAWVIGGYSDTQVDMAIETLHRWQDELETGEELDVHYELWEAGTLSCAMGVERDFKLRRNCELPSKELLRLKTCAEIEAELTAKHGKPKCRNVPKEEKSGSS